MDAHDDRRLVAEFLATRSEAAFHCLYDRHADALYRFAARLSDSGPPDPADVVQEVWIEALQHLDRFEWRSALRTWLCAIALNRWRRGLRLRRERTGEVRESEAPLVRGPDGLRIRIERALASLPDGYREVLVLHDVEGYTHEEIAAHFGIAAGTSKSQLHHARRALRARLGSIEVTHDS